MKPAFAPPPPPAAKKLFGTRIDLACRYAELLAGPGVDRGLIGPREVPRLWDRHILNSAVTVELLSDMEFVTDIGSGAGLPGLPMALARPDLHVRLVEPMLRRTEFLEMAVDELDVPVDVVRGRAEDLTVRERAGEAHAVVSRAVSNLEKLAEWSFPLLRSGGRMLALKGERAQEELDECRTSLLKLGAGDMRMVRCGVGYVEPQTTVVVVDSARSGRRAFADRRK